MATRAAPKSTRKIAPRAQKTAPKTTEKAAPKPASSSSKDKPKSAGASDVSLDTEFSYYCALLQDLIPTIEYEIYQEIANKWLTKLCEPFLNVKTLRDKRNRYLQMLCIGSLAGETQVPFNEPPPVQIPEIAAIKKPMLRAPAWHESAAEWKEHLALLAELGTKLKIPAIRKCQTHAKQCSGGKDARGTFLDRQFEFFLFLSRSYLRSMKSYPELRLACRWVEALSQIDQKCCIRAKGIRNDYALALMGYLLHHQMVGPFRSMPVHPLEPLLDAARKVADNTPMTRIDDFGLNEKGDFLSNFPLPEEGAFAFISLSSALMQKMGELTNS
ncbi:uncharacterized protein LOC131688636 [Topomyia yanbarensis]|uniref:uncharacterized protein LOC131688636 n=1 Tax=Topomyia yanbarensis TaxID=2498891 RepID=UPI00273C3D39|nr:uncharacterized protein LOC131688636 [Topomyia yanbarensis]